MSDVLVGSRVSAIAPSAPEVPVSAVSWAAIIAGAVVAAATSVALLALGGGIGLGSVSPWQNSGVSATTFGMLAALWLIAVQLFACGVGGYIAGRLRTQWVGVHTDEVFFRDTAHGFLVWAVGAIIGAGLITSAASSLVSTTAQVGATALGGVTGAAANAVGQAVSPASDPTAYFTDALFRSDQPTTDANDTATRAEVGRTLARSLADGQIAPPDRTYVAHMIASRTGLSQADAEKRVDGVISQAKAAADAAAAKAKQAADATRKAGVYLSLWVFVSLLVGAFAASYMATVGGRIRDDLPAMG
jgi:hypothetical protein